MPQFTNPSEIARETLKQLSTRRIAPTPDHYRTIYLEIAGLPDDGGDEAAGRLLEALRDNLPTSTTELSQTASQFKKELASRNWQALEQTLIRIARQLEPKEPLPWAGLIRELLRVWETKYAGLTTAKKRDGLETVLNNFGANPELLLVKLQSLFKSWSETPVSQTELVTSEEIDAAAVAEAATAATQSAAAEFEPARIDIPQDANPADLVDALKELLANTLYSASAPLLEVTPDLAEEAVILAKKAREARDAASFDELGRRLKQFWYRLEMSAGDEAELHQGLIRLLRLVIENISELLADDQWIRGQIQVIQEIVNNPIKPSVLVDAERSLKAVIYKQSLLKHSLIEAKSTFKTMITSFIDRLGDFSETTGEYHHKIEDLSQKLHHTDDITQINIILEDVMKETKMIQLNTLRSKEQVVIAQQQVLEANRKITELENELENMSEMVREDQLTRTLNRRGLEEAFEREAARADRKKTPLCVAILDIDNFKKLNDTYGHQAGDSALVHLSTVIKEMIRPNDTVARYGGEEFVVILPDSDLEHSIQVMSRVQRELTKKFFMADNQKLVITFSAGVALREAGETQDSAIRRSDEAMYQAKKSGKNRVVAAAPGKK